MGIEENKQVIRDYCDAIARGDYETVAKLFTPDCVVWAAGNCWFSGEFDPPSMFKSAERMFTILKDFRFVIKDMTAEGNRVAVEMESDARHVDGTPYNNKYHFLFIISDDGRIAVCKEYMDTMYAGKILGVEAPRLG